MVRFDTAARYFRRHAASPAARTASPEDRPLLRIRALHSTHGGPFSLDVAPGECLVIAGPSGAGKSVLLRMIADLDPHRGEVQLDGADRARMSAPAWRSQVIYQAAEAAWWKPTAGEHFSAQGLHSIQPLLSRLGLDRRLLDAPVERLSTGERQRMALLRSLARRPRVLLLDEPTSALDEASTEAAEGLLRECLAEGLALLIVTHSTEQAARLGHRHIEIRDGRMHTAASAAHP